MTDWTDRTLLELLKLAATPIDFDQLIAAGVLRKHGRGYELLDLAGLSEHARRKIRIKHSAAIVLRSRNHGDEVQGFFSDELRLVDRVNSGSAAVSFSVSTIAART